MADTGFWLALANRRDAHHELAREALAEIVEPLVTTWPVMTETCHLLATRLSVDAEVAFIDSLLVGSFTLFDLTAAHMPRVRDLMLKYRDLPMDLADASLVVLAEQLGDGRILTTDRRNFRTYRWKNRKPFKNLIRA